MSNINFFYDALEDGAWQPQISLERLANHEYKASYVDQDGDEHAFSDHSSSYAISRLTELLFEQVREGKIRP